MKNTIKDKIMQMLKVKGFALLLPLVIIGVVASVGFGAHYITKKDDGPVEEAAEEIIEDQIEESFGTHAHVDLSPGSKEMNE